MLFLATLHMVSPGIAWYQLKLRVHTHMSSGDSAPKRHSWNHGNCWKVERALMYLTAFVLFRSAIQIQQLYMTTSGCQKKRTCNACLSECQREAHGYWEGCSCNDNDNNNDNNNNNNNNNKKKTSWARSGSPNPSHTTRTVYMWYIVKIS